MALEIRLKPVETLIFRSDVVAIGKFRCPADHPLFRDSGPCTNHVFVFPRTSTEIEHAGGPRFVAGPNTISIYNQHQAYTRRRLSPMDASDWYTVADDLLLDAVRACDPSAAERPGRPFRVAAVPASPSLYLEQRLLFTSIERGEADPLEVEERVLRILSRVLRAANPASPGPKTLRDAVETAKRLIAANPTANVPLRSLAGATGTSPFQLCRSFRSSTGMTLTAYRHALRLRSSLERLRDGGTQLTDVALDLGFSSHSHFTFAFRRQFGITPSDFRARA